MLLTSYFTSKQHPQNGDSSVFGIELDGKIPKDSFAYIEEWYNSVMKHNLRAVVFYDDLSDLFIREFSNQNISFEKVANWDVHALLSLNDSRFIHYYLYLLNLEVKPEWVFMTDISDVEVIQNPKSLNFNEFDFFACDEEMSLDDYSLAYKAGLFEDAAREFNWRLSRYAFAYKLLNAGVLGGAFDNVMKFLSYYSTERLNCKKFEYNINMPLVNFVLRTLFDENILSGYPFNSRYKRFEERNDVYFKHK